METGLMEAKAWAQMEFGRVELADQRRTKRLVRVAARLAEYPSGTLPSAFAAPKELKAAYRFFGNESVTYAEMVAPHFGRTRETAGVGGEYLLIEDTTELDFTGHPATRGVGRIGNDGGLGLYVHTTLATRVERWNVGQEPEVTLVGLFGQDVWARTTPARRGRERKRDRLLRPRESDYWAASVAASGGPPPGARWTYLADRESDVYEAFERCERGRTEFIIRASRPRALADEGGSVFTAVASVPCQGTFTLRLRARPGRAAREALVEVRSVTVSLRGPWRPAGRLAPRRVNVVEAREIRAPAGVEAVHWVLLTTWPTGTFDQALRVVKTYTKRWLIEEYHKALKTGARIEESQLSTAGEITALLGVLALVAVRLLNLKLLAASRPEEAVDAAMLEPEAWAILKAKFGQPVAGWSHRTLLVTIARMGGFLARKGDGSPGWMTIWRGWQRLALMAQGAALLLRGHNCG